MVWGVQPKPHREAVALPVSYHVEIRNYLQITENVVCPFTELVKNGETTAVIEIHISNQGFDAFEPENYGDRIIVIRTILERGGGSYKILNQQREVVSRSKTKLDTILRYFEITVNNPITILTQDCARTFLRE